MLHLTSRRALVSSLALLTIAAAAPLSGCGEAAPNTGGSGGTTATTTGSSGGAGGAGGSGGSATGGAGGSGGSGGSGGATTTSTTTTTTTNTLLDPWTGPLESLGALDLGEVTYGVQKTVFVPDRTLGFTLQVEGADASSVVGVYRLRPPAGADVILDFGFPGHATQYFGGLELIGASVPQSDTAESWPVVEGKWKLTLGSDGTSGATGHVRAWMRRTNDGAFHGGVLDVNLFVVPGAASQSYLDQVLDQFFPYAGLERGTVKTYSVPSSYATIGSPDEYRSLLASSASVGSAPAINLFVVDDFSDNAYGGAIGVAGGIPGSPMRHGTPQSGLAYQPSGDPGYDATVLMHEIGHLGGLFHTTEFAIDETDPLSDTPACAHATITSNPDACADRTNVMFPIAYGATAFSSAQRHVLQGSALYRGILDAGGAPAAPLSVVAGGGAPTAFAPDALAAGVAVMPVAPDPLERALGALWCGGGLDAAALTVARDPAVKLNRATTGDAAARLRAVALDATLPVLLRKRALKLHVEAARAQGKHAEAADVLLAITDGPVGSIADRRMRTAALRLVGAARAGAPGAFVKRIDKVIAEAALSPDPLVAAVASGR